MNQFCLVGRIAELPELSRNAAGWNTCLLNLKIQRSFPESDGSYADDIVEIEVNRGSAETLAACADVNDWISVKGRIERIPKPAEMDRADPETSPSVQRKKISLERSRKMTREQKSRQKVLDQLEKLEQEKRPAINEPVGQYKFIAESLEYIHHR